MNEALREVIKDKIGLGRPLILPISYGKVKKNYLNNWFIGGFISGFITVMMMKE